MSGSRQAWRSGRISVLNLPLDYKCVAAGVVLVSNTPALLTILVYFAFEEKTIPLSFVGIFVVLGGTAVIAQDGSAGSVAVLGNAMTILSAVTLRSTS